MGLSFGRLGDGINSVSKGTAFRVAASQFSFTLEGDLTGTILIEGSVLEKPDPDTAAHWFTLHSFAGAGHAFVTGKPCIWIRYNCTVDSGGTGTIHHAAME